MLTGLNRNHFCHPATGPRPKTKQSNNKTSFINATRWLLGTRSRADIFDLKGLGRKRVVTKVTVLGSQRTDCALSVLLKTSGLRRGCVHWHKRAQSGLFGRSVGLRGEAQRWQPINRGYVGREVEDLRGSDRARRCDAASFSWLIQYFPLSYILRRKASELSDPPSPRIHTKVLSNASCIQFRSHILGCFLLAC